MVYTQMTLDEWVILKDQLKQDILDAQDKVIGIKKDFVRIGYKLRKIEELKLYEKDGYKSVAEFAKAECKLSSSDVTRFMQINERYSIDGYSEELREEFLAYGSSKLAEMLTLPDKDMEMIQPEATRGSIRGLKAFNKSEPETGVADDIQKLIEKFYEENAEVLNGVFEEYEGQQDITERRKEIVNPSGNKAYKKGMYFMMMYEDGIKIKKFGGETQKMSWEEFFAITETIFGEAADGKNTWKNYFGVEAEEEKKEDETDNGRENAAGGTDDGISVPDEGEGESKGTAEEGEESEEPEQDTVSEVHDSEPEESERETETGEESDESEAEKCEEEVEEKQPEIKEKTEIAPAQKREENQGRIDVSESEKMQEEELETEENEAEETAPEIIEKPFGTRKDYLNSLTIQGTALYLVKSYDRGELTEDMLLHVRDMGEWLETQVDKFGHSMEV